MASCRGRERCYRLVFRGEGDVLAGAFPDLTSEIAEGNTALAGAVLDQAQLRGIIDHAESLGLELVSVNPIERDGGRNG